MTERENVIRRWVRLKQASKERAADTGLDGAAATATPVTDTPGTTPTQAEAAGDAPFDLTSLPPVEAITADTDIVTFLRAGVPAELTRAALRRAWASDPGIRDFIGIAENQWDFNDPDAIPGFGPLTSTEASAGALAQISGRFEEAITELTSPGDSVNPPAARSPLNTAQVQISGSVEQDGAQEMPAADSEQDELIEDCHVPEKRRRHGGALPR
jgi:hypothetical protein